MQSKRTAACALVMLIALLCACGETPDVGGETHVSSASKLNDPPKVVLPDGFAVTLEIAATPEERATGLMYRPSLPVDRGMLFLFERPGLWQFWMKDTMISLDIVFLDSAGKVTQVFNNAEPCKVEPCKRYVPKDAALAVLELLGGTAEKHGVKPGVTLRFERVPGYPQIGTQRSVF